MFVLHIVFMRRFKTCFQLFFKVVGRWGLSGSAPCRWYINEDLPEINELNSKYVSGGLFR